MLCFVRLHALRITRFPLISFGADLFCCPETEGVPILFIAQPNGCQVFPLTDSLLPVCFAA